MFTKAQIDSEKVNPYSTFFKKVLAPTYEASKILYVLDNLGKLPDTHNAQLNRKQRTRTIQVVCSTITNGDTLL